ncbi:GNAT family N-acetyltransferase [Paenibacillus turpanensis]|uniref:GNAT family N-acetyltransferase n=1 Tax=Paenibacillus turpanensis TaxID=2689078 RepID=UPI00140C453A|nr:GNAT family N-acetyltransferase [Paenibacillus turpanensis]
MLIDIQHRLEDGKIAELLGYSVFPDPEQLERARALYKTNPKLSLLGLEEEGEVIGLIGYEKLEHGVIRVLHLAVDPLERGKGYGRGIILELLASEEPKRVVADTDEEAIEFYRNIGFAVESLGELYPGVERFRCTYDSEDEE